MEHQYATVNGLRPYFVSTGHAFTLYVLRFTQHAPRNTAVWYAWKDQLDALPLD